MKKVLGIGNALVDILVRIDSDEILDKLGFPKGSMQLVDKKLSDKVLKKVEKFDLQTASGGSTANTIHGLANLGVDTAYVGKIGNDYYGNFFIKDIVNNKIKSYILNGEADTGCAISLISPDSERTFATYLGAAIELSADDINEEMFKNYDYVHIEGYLIPNQALVEKVTRLAKKNNCITSIDLASFNVVEDNIDFLKEVITNNVDIVFANEEEAKSFTGEKPEGALNNIAKITDIAVVKIGREGSLIKQGDNIYKVSSIKVNAIDTTGAGDLFAAGFLYGLVNNFSLEKCAEIGSFMGGKVVEVIGPKMIEKTWKEIREKVNEIHNR